MSEPDGRRFHNGGTQGLGALVVAAVTATMVAASNWTGDNVAGRFAIAGVVLFAIALAVGSARLVGVASLPVLGSALFASATADSPAWVRSIVVGCLWYVAVELAWDSIERRKGVKRSPALELRRINEVSSIVVISLGVTVTAYAASSLDAPRTLIGQAVIVVALLAALVFAIRHVVATGARPAESRDT
jgi:hypothetical protein